MGSQDVFGVLIITNITFHLLSSTSWRRSCWSNRYCVHMVSIALFFFSWKCNRLTKNLNVVSAISTSLFLPKSFVPRPRVKSWMQPPRASRPVSEVISCARSRLGKRQVTHQWWHILIVQEHHFIRCVLVCQIWWHKTKETIFAPVVDLQPSKSILLTNSKTIMLTGTDNTHFRTWLC